MSPVAIVSGGADDVRAAGAMRLAGAGMDVALIGPEPDANAELARCVAQKRQRSIAIEADVADAASVDAAVADVREALGDPTVLLHVISLTACCPLRGLSEDDWRAMITGPLRGMFLTSRAVLDPMLQNGVGHIITVAGVAGLDSGRSRENQTVRAALEGFMRTIAMELRSFGITANLIVPASPAAGISLVTNADTTGDARTRAHPTYAAQAAATLPFLIGDTASAMSGQVICLGE